jgi:AcrR family transcriptional regulator
MRGNIPCVALWESPRRMLRDVYTRFALFELMAFRAYVLCMNIAMRSTYHHGNLGPALIAAARELLDEDGPGAVSLREAARRVGVSATATYRHFQDKDHLLAAVAAEGFREFAQKLRDAESGGGGFTEMGVAYVDFALAHAGLFRLMFGPLLRQRELYPELGAAADGAFAALLTGAQRFVGERDEDVESVAYAAWSFSHGLARLVLDDVIPHERAVNVCKGFVFSRPN